MVLAININMNSSETIFWTTKDEPFWK